MPWEFSVTLTIGPGRRELKRELTPIMLISWEILEGLTTKGLPYQSTTHKGAKRERNAMKTFDIEELLVNISLLNNQLFVGIIFISLISDYGE